MKCCNCKHYKYKPLPQAWKGYYACEIAEADVQDAKDIWDSNDQFEDLEELCPYFESGDYEGCIGCGCKDGNHAQECEIYYNAGYGKRKAETT